MNKPPVSTVVNWLIDIYILSYFSPGLLIFLYRIVDTMISATKQMEAVEANVCRGSLQNDSEELESFTGQWRLLSAWRVCGDAGAAVITKNWVAAQLK